MLKDNEVKKSEEIKLLSDAAHLNSKNKGFWDVKLTQQLKRRNLMLIICEIAEAVESIRKDKRVQPESDQFDEIHDFKGWYEHYFKGSLEEEVADIYIRLMDMIGGWQLKTDTIARYIIKELEAHENQGIGEPEAFLFILARSITDICFAAFTVQPVGESIGKLEHFAKCMEIDLMRQVNLKMKYNTMREHKHGKKF